MRWAGAAALGLAAALLSACEQEQMADQRKYEAYEVAPGFADGVSALQPPEGTIPHDARLAPTPDRPPVTMALLRRGQSMFDAACSPCHSRIGDGDGMIVRRGFPPPPSFHTDRLRRAPDRHFYDVITNGFGIMYPYADRVAPQDRWAVIAYIRALQLSQHAKASALPSELRDALETSEGETQSGEGDHPDRRRR